MILIHFLYSGVARSWLRWTSPAGVAEREVICCLLDIVGFGLCLKSKSELISHQLYLTKHMKPAARVSLSESRRKDTGIV